jgi:hypothetical protein
LDQLPEGLGGGAGRGREVGTPYNKSAYDAEAKREAKREADALAKKNAAPPKAP